MFKIRTKCGTYSKDMADLSLQTSCKLISLNINNYVYQDV